MSTEAFDSNLAVLKSKLAGFGRFRRLWSTLDGLARFVIIAGGSFLLWIGLDAALPLPVWLLLPLVAILAAVSLWAGVQYLIRPQLKRSTPADEAFLVEQLQGRMDNRLIGALQLGSSLQEATATGKALGHSSLLVKELVTAAARFMETHDVRKLVDRVKTRRFLAGASIAAVMVALCLVFAMDVVRTRVFRVQDAYAVLLDTLFPVDMQVKPGDIFLVRGRPVTLTVKAVGARRQEARLIRTDIETGESVSTPLSLVKREASVTLSAVESAFTYKFQYARRFSAEHRVLVGDLPEITSINFEQTPPPYTGQPMRMQTGRIAKLQGLAGTAVFVSFAANTALHADYCYVEWQDGQKQRIDISSRFGSFAFSITGPERATIHLTGHYGPEFQMERPMSFEVAVVADKAPTIQPVLPRMETTAIPPESAMGFSVPWLAQDDVGVKKVDLVFEVDTVSELLGRGKREGSFTQEIDPARDRAKGKFAGLFNALQPPLAPGDKIKIVLSATDNNTESGPGVGRSDPIELLLIGSGLGTFAEAEFGLGRRRESALLLNELERVKRETDLLQNPVKTDRTETPMPVVKQTLEANASQKSMLGGAEDDIGRYFELLSGGGK